jgi:hypothetical protein
MRQERSDLFYGASLAAIFVIERRSVAALLLHEPRTAHPA